MATPTYLAFTILIITNQCDFTCVLATQIAIVHNHLQIMKFSYMLLVFVKK